MSWTGNENLWIWIGRIFSSKELNELDRERDRDITRLY